jgi:C1A family cysteine protease
MKESKLMAILIVSMLVAVFFVTLIPLGAQNSSTSQSAVSGQSSGQLTEAPLNPEWVAYQQNLTAGKAVTTKTASGNSLGAIPAPVDLSYLNGKGVAGTAAVLPASYDLRTLGKVTSVKNQLPYGTCWTFATFASIESYLLTAETRNFSEYNLVMQSGFDGAGLDRPGNAFMSTAYLARWNGPLNEVDDAYPGGDVHAAIPAIQKHVQNVDFLPGRASSTDNSNIKAEVMANGGEFILFYIDDSHYSTSPATYYNPTATTTNHAVTIVGWDDNYATSNFRGIAGAPPGNGAFIVKNSWGTSWGDGGYFYLSYYNALITQATSFTAEPTSNYAKEYQYDPLGWTTSLGYGDTTMWGANVFTASSSEQLKAVSFYTDDVSTQYQVYIYTDPTSGSPIGGTQYVGPTGTTVLPGYHTVKLTSPISLSAGQRFSVVVKFTTSSYGFPLVIEKAVSGYSSAATASPGQSYYSHDGSGWTDLTTYNSTANSCIKAFTGTTPGGWGPWASLGGNILAGTSPAACSPASGQTDWFVVGTNHQLYYTSNGGSSWTSLGGSLTSSPAAVSPSAGVIDVFARGTNGALYQKHYSGGAWGAWTNLGGKIPAGTSPAACSWGASREDLFVQGTNGALYQNTWTGTWSGWTSLGGSITSSPAATSPASGVIDAFARGTNGALYTKHYLGGTWGAWTNLGGQIPAGTSPAACSWGASREDLFVQGTNGALYQNTWTGTWSGWTSLGGSITSSPAAVSPASGVIDVGVRGTNGALYERIYTGG